MHPSDRAPFTADEQSWARRVAAGDINAFEAAFRACYGSMCSFVRVQVGSAETAEDLVQDVFMRIWQARQRLDPAGSLRNLLYRSAFNASLNYLKHRNIEDRWLRVSAVSDAARDADDPASFDELGQALDRALAALPERCRLIFMMSRYQGLSYAEIAEALGLSVKTVETQMGRALKALRVKLSAHIG